MKTLFLTISIAALTLMSCGRCDNTCINGQCINGDCACVAPFVGEDCNFHGAIHHSGKYRYVSQEYINLGDTFVSDGHDETITLRLKDETDSVKQYSVDWKSQDEAMLYFKGDSVGSIAFDNDTLFLRYVDRFALYRPVYIIKAIKE